MLDLIPASEMPAAVSHERITLEYRPTAVIIARKQDGTHLLINTINENDPDIWWPVQGGIDDDTPHVGAARELKEEVDVEVCPDRLVMLGGVRYANGRKRDGFTCGKLLVGFAADIDARREANPNPLEVRDLRYVPEKAMRQIIENNAQLRPSTELKASFILHLLDNLPVRR